jgi:hypothetical protein
LSSSTSFLFSYCTIFSILMASGRLQLAGSVEVGERFLYTRVHRLLALAHPHTWVKVLLVGLVGAVRVANGSEQVVLLAQDVVAHTRQVGVLHVGVDVDLDHAVADGLLVLLLGRAGAAVEDEEDGLVRGRADLLLDVQLVLLEQLGVQADVAGLVDAVHVAEASSNREVGADGAEGVVDGQDVLRLCVERVVVDVLVVDAVLLTTGDTDFLVTKSAGMLICQTEEEAYHLEPLLQGSSTLEVLGGGLNVPVNRLLRQVNHVRGEERLAVRLEVALVLVEQAVQPGQQLLGAVVGVEDDGDAVGWGNAADVVGAGNGTGDGSFLVRVGDALYDISILYFIVPAQLRTSVKH